MKKFLKVLCFIFGFGFLLAGCATVGNITNSNSEIIYNGNSAVLVDGYLYYGNAFADISGFSSDRDYKTNARVSYLARLNTNALEAKSEDYSPKNVENVTSEVVGYENGYMFVLGDYIYYATPNRQKAENADGETSNYYNYTTFYRSRLNGDGKSKIYTTSGEISEFQVLKYDGQYYMMMLVNTSLIRIRIGNSVGSVETIADDVTSAAIPKTYQQDAAGSTLNWNGQIYYTTARTDEDNSDVAGTNIYRIGVNEATENAKKIDAFSDTRTFVGRERDILFFQTTENGNNTVYYVDSSRYTGDKLLRSSTLFYTGTVSDLKMIATNENDYVGFVFNNASSELMYARRNASAQKVTFMNGTKAVSDYNILQISGRKVILSTTANIFTADLSTINSNGEVACTTVVTMTAIYDGTLSAFDGKYVYFYAQLEEVEDEDADEEETEEETDENYYLYRAKVDVNPNNPVEEYQLLGLTTINSRHTK